MRIVLQRVSRASVTIGGKSFERVSPLHRRGHTDTHESARTIAKPDIELKDVHFIARKSSVVQVDVAIRVNTAVVIVIGVRDFHSRLVGAAANRNPHQFLIGPSRC